MIVLDTHVLSELMRLEATSNVLGWMDAQPQDELMLTAISAAEIFHGAARLPDGKQKTALQQAAATTLNEDFAGRILAFDEVAAAHYGDVVSMRERAGRPISM